MASIITNQHGGSYCPQAQFEVTLASSTPGSATYNWVLKWVTHGYTVSSSASKAYEAKIDGVTVASGSFAIGGKTSTTIASGTYTINKTKSNRSVPIYLSFAMTFTWSGTSGSTKTASGSFSIGAKASYTISYNLNGGSGTFNNQVKWYDENVILNTNKPTRTGHSFVRWNTNTSNTGTSYNPGATYTGNAALTLYAIWKANTYTVTYNANGGTGAPANQTKTYGTDLTLSSTKPTRTNYNFLGWATSASATTATYAAGAKYTNNAAVTLYAVWELAYVKPRITNFAANRCTSNGTISESGTYVKVTFNWATDKTVTAIKIQHKLQTTTTWTATNVTASGTSGTVSQVIGGGAISTENMYHVRAYVSDGSGDDYTTYSTTLSIGTIKFPIDVKDKGTGVAIGKAAETENLFDVNWKTRIRGALVVDGDAQAHAKVVSRCGSDTSGTAGWYKVASCTMSGYGNTSILYYIKGGYSKGYYGLLELEMRTSSTKIECWKCEWLARSGFSMSHVRIVISNMTWTLYVYNPVSQYGRIYFSEIQHRGLQGLPGNYPITYYDSNTPETTVPTASVMTTDLPIKTKLMTIAPASRYEVSGDAWATLPVPCDSKLSDTSNGLLTMSNNGIKIGPNIKTVKISASLCFYQYLATGEIDLKIYKNNDIVGAIYGNSENNYIFTVTTNPIAISVAEGDMIYLKMVKGSGENLTLLHNQGSTSLTVEIVN